MREVREMGTETELTREQTIRALRYCQSDKGICAKCILWNGSDEGNKYRPHKYSVCREELAKACLYHLEEIEEVKIMSRNEYKKKESFVRYDLRQMICNMGINIVDVCYKVEHSIETVTLLYKNGYTRKVDVTADSLLALSRDVLKSL
jgi:hypothetical protein